MTPVAYSLFDDLGQLQPVTRLRAWVGARLARRRPVVNGRTPA
jgi:hypothetical protein